MVTGPRSFMQHSQPRWAILSWIRVTVISLVVFPSTGYVKHTWNGPSIQRLSQLRVSTTTNEITSTASYRDGKELKPSISQKISHQISQERDTQFQALNTQFNSKSPDKQQFTVLGTPLLTHKEEIELAYKIQKLSELERIRDDLFISTGEIPTQQQWSDSFSGSPESFERRITEGRHAKDVMVNRNLRLVISTARRYQDLGINLSDLVQEGSIGLMKAAEKYDPTRGFRFSTYASYWIQQSLSRCVAFHSRTIRLPTHAHNLLNRARSTRREMYMSTGEIPSDEEVASQIDIPVDKLRFTMKSSRHIISSNSIANKKGKNWADDDITFEDLTLADNKLPEQILEKSMLIHEINDILDLLDQDERLVICLRYGLCGITKSSVIQIANLAGMPQSWVKSMETRAMRKLRCPQQQFKLRHLTAADEPEIFFSEVVKKDVVSSKDLRRAMNFTTDSIDKPSVVTFV